MNYYHKIMADLELALFNLHPDAKVIYTALNLLKELVDGKAGLLNPNSPLVYDKDYPVIEKVMFALKYRNSFSTVSDIETVIKKFEPSFNKGFSTPLQKLQKHGAIFSVNPTGSNKTVYYGLFGCLDEDGKVKKEYF